MTGFGRAPFSIDDISFEVEVRSINSRYLDVRARLPRLLAAFEYEIRPVVQKIFTRGKVAVTVAASETSSAGANLKVDTEAAAQYVRAAETLRKEHRVEGRLEVASLLSLPGVAQLAEPVLDPDTAREALLAGVRDAVAAADKMRASEGAALDRDVRQRIQLVSELAAGLTDRSVLVQEAVRERLRKRAAQLERDTGPLDESRLAQEVVFAADRLDITEELVRIKSHFDQFNEILDSGDVGKPVGRRLDFLVQEFGREVNTVGSKGNDAPIAHTVVELKTELERVREQIQNIE